MMCQASIEVDKGNDNLIREKGGAEAMKEKEKLRVHEEGMRLLGAPSY